MRLIIDSSGSLYGTTREYGLQDQLGGAESILHSFVANATDGLCPVCRFDYRQRRKSLWYNPEWRSELRKDHER